MHREKKSKPRVPLSLAGACALGSIAGKRCRVLAAGQQHRIQEKQESHTHTHTHPQHSATPSASDRPVRAQLPPDPYRVHHTKPFHPDLPPTPCSILIANHRLNWAAIGRGFAAGRALIRWRDDCGCQPSAGRLGRG